MERAGDEHEIYRDIMRKLFVINRLHHVSIESRAEKLCLHRSQHMMLVVISMADKPLTQRELSERLDISPSAVAIQNEGNMLRNYQVFDVPFHPVFLHNIPLIARKQDQPAIRICNAGQPCLRQPDFYI